MKRVYKKNHHPRDPRAVLEGASTFLSRNWSKTLAGIAAVLLILLLVSCLLVLADAHIWPPVAQEVKEIETPGGTPPPPPVVQAVAAVLIDQESGMVLYEKNAHLRLPIASTTKMMTALVVREQLDLDDQVTITPAAASVGEQEIWLSPGEVLTVEELLWALMVQSANDAAYALAEYTTGGVESFARLMNKKAQSIGAVDSNFTNPHGLDMADHFSTAYDLALIGRELLADPVLAEMAGCKQYDLRWTDHPYPRTCLSHNELLGTYPGVTGIKTGYTANAGSCLVASATRDSKSLVAVALNSEYRESDLVSMLDYGFTATARVVLVENEEDLGRTRVSAYPRRYVTAIPREELAVLSILGSGNRFEVKTAIAGEADSKVEKGDTLGKVLCSVESRPLYEVDAVAASSAESPKAAEGIIWFLWYVLCWAGRIVTAPVIVWL